MAITIKDIAQRVGKSTTTVSRALNDYSDISPETKAMIHQVANEMGYSPNTLAQRLQKQRTDTLAFILPTFGPRFSDPFFSEFLAGIGNKAAQYGFDLLVATRPPGETEMDAYRFNIQGHRTDGFIIVRTRRNDPRIEFLKQTGFPFVAFGRTLDSDDFPYVDEDGEFGMSLVIDYLYQLGHRRIACLLPPEDLTFAYYRRRGIEQKSQQLALTPDQIRLEVSDLTQRGGYQVTQALLDHEHSPTAIVACNDLMAFGAMSAAQDRGLEVGKDISITGFDDIPLAEHSHPPLTTVHQPVYQIGGMVTEMLVKKIRGQALENERVLLQPSLIVRSSCGPPPTS
jgi:LacI family transcriptional regulator, galactose operon repressor